MEELAGRGERVVGGGRKHGVHCECRFVGGAQRRDIYLDKCAVCHGKDGAGKTAKGRKAKVKDIRETIGKMSVDEMIKVVEDYRSLAK